MELCIQDNKTIDYETTTQFNVIFEVSDGFLTNAAVLLIDVTDVNEPPVFKSSVYYVTTTEGSVRIVFGGGITDKEVVRVR